jgi:hypothetical protein
MELFVSIAVVERHLRGVQVLYLMFPMVRWSDTIKVRFVPGGAAPRTGIFVYPALPGELNGNISIRRFIQIETDKEASYNTMHHYFHTLGPYHENKKRSGISRALSTLPVESRAASRPAAFHCSCICC